MSDIINLRRLLTIGLSMTKGPPSLSLSSIISKMDGFISHLTSSVHSHRLHVSVMKACDRRIHFNLSSRRESLLSKFTVTFLPWINSGFIHSNEILPKENALDFA